MTALVACATGGPGEGTGAWSSASAGATVGASMGVAESTMGTSADAGADACVGQNAAAGSDADDDTGPEADPGDSGADDTVSVTPPAAGDLVISEVMFAPSGPEPEAEWFEIYNAASAARLLSGLTIRDGYLDTHIIAGNPPVILGPGAYALLVRDAATATLERVPAGAITYEYGTGLANTDGIELDDGDESDLSLWSGNTRLADVPYGTWRPVAYGQSIERRAGAIPSVPEPPDSFCLAQVPWAPGSDDGTPGQASDCP
ncbi:MAG: lamin tail domain-containing protein [Polyangiaceae bacterium]